jgi:hypothetical protein
LIEFKFGLYKCCIILLLFWLTRIDPGQPFWPVTRSLYRVDHRVGFKNYVHGSMLDYIILGYLIDITKKKAKSELYTQIYKKKCCVLINLIIHQNLKDVA